MLRIVRAAIDHGAQVDVYGDDTLIVRHDVPAALEPTRPVPPMFALRSVESGDIGFGLLSQTPQGLRSYARLTHGDQPALLILPPSTWVVGDPLVLARVALAYARSPRPLPLLRAASGSLEDTFAAHARPPAWVPFADQSRGGEVIFYASRDEAAMPLALKVVDRDPGTANAAAQDLRRLRQARALQPQPAEDDAWADLLAHVASIRADGDTLLVVSNVTQQSAQDFADRAR